MAPLRARPEPAGADVRRGDRPPDPGPPDDPPPWRGPSARAGLPGRAPRRPGARPRIRVAERDPGRPGPPVDRRHPGEGLARRHHPAGRRRDRQRRERRAPGLLPPGPRVHRQRHPRRGGPAAARGLRPHHRDPGPPGEKRRGQDHARLPPALAFRAAHGGADRGRRSRAARGRAHARRRLRLVPRAGPNDPDRPDAGVLRHLDRCLRLPEGPRRRGGPPDGVGMARRAAEGVRPGGLLRLLRRRSRRLRRRSWPPAGTRSDESREPRRRTGADRGAGRALDPRSGSRRHRRRVGTVGGRGAGLRGRGGLRGALSGSRPAGAEGRLPDDRLLRALRGRVLGFLVRPRDADEVRRRRGARSTKASSAWSGRRTASC